MILTSSSFADGAMLPFECAYEGANASPALSWSGAPAGTKSFAISCIDHSSPNPVGWVHWLQWNIPAFETRRLPGLAPYACLDDGCEQGLNDFLEFGWGGPCPPLGLHRYQFSLYALDSLVYPESPRLDAFWNAMTGHILDTAELSAYYAADGSLSSYEALGREGRMLLTHSA